MGKGAYINEEGVLVVDMAEADKLWNSLNKDQQFDAMCAMFDPLLARATELKAKVEALEARVAAADALAEAVSNYEGATSDELNLECRMYIARDDYLAAYEATKKGGA